jgi:N-acetylglucosamine-6-phosphate deacetylase
VAKSGHARNNSVNKGVLLMSHQDHGEICVRHYTTRNVVKLSWDKGVITCIEPTDAEPQGWVGPGLFDLQINGYGGIDFQQDHLTTDDLLHATRALRAAGSTRFFLTLITDEWDKLTSRLRHLRALRSRSPELTSALAGWHVEGPFLSKEPGFHGAHDPALLIEPTPEHILELHSIVEDEPLLLTVSPEVNGVIRAINIASERDIKVSLGHTNASTEQITGALNAGATGFTHLGNGCPRLLDRHDNVLWRILDRDDVMVSLIPDNIHVSPTLFRLLHRLIESNRIYYTTDAMAAAGMPPGNFTLGKLNLEVGPDQVVRQPGQSLFAGSALKPIDGIFRAAGMLRSPWQDVWRRFSETPAAFVGLRNELAVGQPADFCTLSTTDAQYAPDVRIYKGGVIAEANGGGANRPIH